MHNEETQQPDSKHDALKRLAQVPVCDDIVEYTLACVLALAPRTSAAIKAAVESQVRETFGGDEVWISKGAAQQRQERDAQLKRDYLAGERVELLMRRYQLNRRRVFQIIKS